MTLEQRHYVLPLAGTVIDWVAFSGDENDGVRVVGPHHYRQSLPIGDGVENEFEMTLLEILDDVDNGEAYVMIEASQAFHDGFTVFLDGKTVSEIVDACGETLLTRGKNQKPRRSLNFRP